MLMKQTPLLIHSINTTASGKRWKRKSSLRPKKRSQVNTTRSATPPSLLEHLAGTRACLASLLRELRESFTGRRLLLGLTTGAWEGEVVVALKVCHWWKR